jgi:hypothetical protein
LVDGIFKLYAQRPRHCFRMAGPIANVKCLDLTPSAPYGWSWGIVSAIDCEGRTIWIVDAHRDDGKRFIVRADEILTAFMELETAIRARHSTQGIAERVQVNLDRLPR